MGPAPVVHSSGAWLSASGGNSVNNWSPRRGAAPRGGYSALPMAAAGGYAALCSDGQRRERGTTVGGMPAEDGPDEPVRLLRLIVDEFKLAALALAGFLVLLGLFALSDTAWWWLLGILLLLATTVVTLVLVLSRRRPRRGG